MSGEAKSPNEDGTLELPATEQHHFVTNRTGKKNKPSSISLKAYHILKKTPEPANCRLLKFLLSYCTIPYVAGSHER